MKDQESFMVNRAFRLFLLSLFVLIGLLPVSRLPAQSLGNAGTVTGTVTDPSGAALPGASVTVQNPVTGYSQAAATTSTGGFRLGNLPPNPYHLQITAPGFATFVQDVVIRNSLPVEISAKLALSSTATTIEVEAGGHDLVETDPAAHVDVDRNLMLKIPAFDPAGGLSQAITYPTGGVAADANGFFHPLGDHAQTSFVIDGQPISDQQSKVFSTQLPASAIQSMELITGAPAAEFGDKSSLIDQITTRSGLGAMRTFGSVNAYYGAFGTVGADAGLGFGNNKVGNFLSLDGSRSSRFLDTPEFTPFHDKGNNQTIFDRLDFQPTSRDVLHLNLFAARNWIQIPNDYDQLEQDQRQRVLTWNIAPGYQHTFNPRYLLTVNPYIRKDDFNYYPSRDLLDDTPSTQNQHRKLMNYGVRSDISISEGRHNIKLGVDLKQTRLYEQFGFGVTDPTFNPPCLDAAANAVTDPGITDPGVCGSLGYTANPGLQPGLIPFDLSRGGSLFQYNAKHNINQYSTYIQDSINLGNLLLNVGLRGDTYYGVTADSAASPRVGLAYNIKKTNTVLRIAYSRTFETPFNENLLLSSATALSNGAAESVLGVSGALPIPPGKRNQYNAGFQQAIGKYLLIDADYFWKYTNNAYDFSTLQNTTITFPISWKKSKLDGVTGRISTTNIHGFQAYWTVGHTRARYFPDQTGGLLNTSIVPPGVFRIDHDQAFQSTLLARYQRPHDAEWVSFTWRYDSGLVVSGVPDVAAALGLTPNQQASIGFACDGVAATVANPFTPASTCNVGTSKLLTLPQTGAEEDDHNPDRVKPRHVLDIAVGSDNLFHADGPRRFTASIQVTNLTNQVSLYNFLSTFSGTHFLQPRMIMGNIGMRF
jgi:hypothetical protein